MALEVQYKLLHLPFASVPQNPWRDGDFNPTLIFHGEFLSQMLWGGTLTQTTDFIVFPQKQHP